MAVSRICRRPEADKKTAGSVPPADTDLLCTHMPVCPVRPVIYAFRTFSPDTLHNPNIPAPQPFFPPE